MSRLSAAGLVLGLALSPLASAQDIPADTEIVELPSGLEYSVLKAGTPGASPRMTDPVIVHYTGWFPDGKVFDSSRKPRRPGLPVEPARFKVGGMVEGWNEALQRMTPGAQWKLTIPSDLGYGDEGRPGIPGGATLIFEVELLSFETGPGLPEFQRPDPETATKLECGALLQGDVEGTGEPIDAGDLTIFHFTAYSLEGELLQSSLFGLQAQKAAMKDVRFEFLKQAAAEIRPSGSAFIEVPAAANPASEESAIWHVQILNKTMPKLDEVPWEKTESGLEYHILKEGEGEAAREGDMATCHYSGWRTDGVLFDSSVGGDAATFPLTNPGVIQGWVEGVPLVRVGGTILLRIPSDLGYGDQGRRDAKIPGKSTLVFEVHLKARADG